MRSAALGLMFGLTVEVNDDVGASALGALNEIAQSGRPLDQLCFVISPEHCYRTSRASLVNSLHGDGLGKLASRVARRTLRPGHLLCLVIGDDEPRLIGLPFAPVRLAFERMRARR